jgi:hypothetical protein
MMTTASTLDNKGNPIQASGNATPFDMGSGQVDPGPAFDPGLVYNSGVTDWIHYSCGVGVHLFSGDTDLCTVFPAIKANQLNYPSIAAGALPGTQTITRTVTDVDGPPAPPHPGPGHHGPGGPADHYTVSVTNPAGYNVTVSPSQFTIHPGQSVSYTVTIRRTTGTLNAYASASSSGRTATARVRTTATRSAARSRSGASRWPRRLRCRARVQPARCPCR